MFLRELESAVLVLLETLTTDQVTFGQRLKCYLFVCHDQNYVPRHFVGGQQNNTRLAEHPVCDDLLMCFSIRLVDQS